MGDAAQNIETAASDYKDWKTITDIMSKVEI